MIKWIFGAMLIASAILGAVSGRISEVSSAALNSCVEAVELCIYLAGGMCMWGGVMRVAEKSGVTDTIARVFKPFLKYLFKGIDTSGKAFHAICMNITANLLGLGNAATPLGLEAMKRLEEEEGESEITSRNMVLFVVLNTASITIIPTTAASLRLKHGSEEPMEILPCVLITSACALIVGIITAMILDKGECK